MLLVVHLFYLYKPYILTNYYKKKKKGYPTGNEKGTYLALEISGVDIYVCQVKLKGEGGKLAINQYQYKIPDNLTAGHDIEVLIDYVADCVADFQQRVGTHKQIIYSMAISIGFAVLQTSLNRGIIIALEHGFEFPNVIGCDAVDLFDKRFRAKGLAVKIVAIANGTLYFYFFYMFFFILLMYIRIYRWCLYFISACLSTSFYSYRGYSQRWYKLCLL